MRRQNCFARIANRNRKNVENMERFGKILRSLFARGPDGRDISGGAVGAPDDADRRLVLHLRRTVEDDRLFLRPGLSVADVADELEADADSVGRAFARITGGDFNRYLDELRIAYAAVLFMSHESHLYSIEKTGIQCGFPNHAAFGNACRRLTGMSPEVMREFAHGRETLRGLFLTPPIYLTTDSADTLEEESQNKNL